MDAWLSFASLGDSAQRGGDEFADYRSMGMPSVSAALEGAARAARASRQQTALWRSLRFFGTHRQLVGRRVAGPLARHGRVLGRPLD